MIRYMQSRGHNKRHTLAMANAEEVQEMQRKVTGQHSNRVRRTGLVTVMERHPGKRNFVIQVLVLSSFIKSELFCLTLPNGEMPFK